MLGEKKYWLVGFTLLVIVALAVVSIGKLRRESTNDFNQNINENVDCITIYDPVCGVDGKTYPNECVATEQNNVEVSYKGECQLYTTLTTDERQYLFWLLQKRAEEGLESVPIRHVETIERDEGFEYVYGWGDPVTQAFIYVVDGEVQSVTPGHN